MRLAEKTSPTGEQELQADQAQNVVRAWPGSRAIALVNVDLKARARRIYADRRRRDRLFGELSVLFRDPAWDIMLDLYGGDRPCGPVSVSSAARAACIPMSTALRCVEQMAARGLVHRWPDPEDGRRTLIRLTASATELMGRHLADETRFGPEG
ncbi:MarR family winged helix-turn-helix transcriptional regulator [Sphingomonas sp.]|jgi:DNA-binding MarR family transcriptional regulator|uniref:MarR family winged helix-turn-helix transcriptional regulator n=1 Tax=Sphingomonas sp. TaxID=28214 RepID=UPI002DEF8AC0|nr:winged helix DNA-binding protein [Sphingomonas sp.]HEV2567904.1 winged helix DNA-binding protein [Sphingomonas sp.]